MPSTTTAATAADGTSVDAATGKKKKSSLFRRNKKDEASGTGGVMRKTRSFKRIRGFLNGQSRRERRAARKAKKAAAAGTSGAPSEADDASTIYGVDVDERSVATSNSLSVASAPAKGGTAATASSGKLLGDSPAGAASVDSHEAFFSGTAASPGGKKAPLLKVVLLLMDPSSRRFELLQLEFDSSKAYVSDVLQQIATSVTEDVLQRQTYTGITGADGKPLPNASLLATYCRGNDVLVAVPQGSTAAECARLAQPILSDAKVGAMLLSSGIDAKAWRDAAKTSKASKKRVKSRAAGFKKTCPKSTASSAGTFVWRTMLVVVVAMLLQVLHLYISAPIRPGHAVSPGTWLVKCGLLSAFSPSLYPCENMFLHVTAAADGKVVLYNANREIAWEMQGDVCEQEEPKDEQKGEEEASSFWGAAVAPDKKCLDGLEFRDDGTVVVGGKPIQWVTTYYYPEDYEGGPQPPPPDLSPWPFTEMPKKVKIWKKNV